MAPAPMSTLLRRTVARCAADSNAFRGNGREIFGRHALGSRTSFSAYRTCADSHGMGIWHGTTILSVRKEGKVVMIGDGQVSLGSTVMKHNARKVRRLGQKAEVIAGFAGATADAFTLFERLEARIEEHPGQLTRACVELAKQWRTDKFLRRLEAMMIVADKNVTLTITGNGDVLEPETGVVGIGSGGMYAISAARALIDVPEMSAIDISTKAMTIASEICVYTNNSFIVEELDLEESK